jgi:hypothetical protein
VITYILFYQTFLSRCSHLVTHLLIRLPHLPLIHLCSKRCWLIHNNALFSSIRTRFLKWESFKSFILLTSFNFFLHFHYFFNLHWLVIHYLYWLLYHCLLYYWLLHYWLLYHWLHFLLFFLYYRRLFLLNLHFFLYLSIWFHFFINNCLFLWRQSHIYITHNWLLPH